MVIARLPALTIAFLLGTWAVEAAAAPAQDFDDANALKDGSACDEAIFRYEEVVAATEAPARLHGLALYNQAVCFEELGRFEAALEGFAAVSGRRWRDAADLRDDAAFRRGAVLLALERDAEAGRAFRSLARRRPAAPERDVIQVHLAWIDMRAGRRVRAARRLVDAVPVLEAALEASGSDERFGAHLAMASVVLGDLHAEEALRRKLSGHGLRDRLAEVGADIDIAQGHYVDAMRRGVPTWAAAAALHLGDVFTAWHGRLGDLRDRLRAGTVRGVDAAEGPGIAAWLDERVGSLARSAHQTYRLCVDVETRSGVRDRFTTTCRDRAAKSSILLPKP